MKWPWNKKPKKKSSRRGYDAASKAKRVSRWFAGNTSANAEISRSLTTLRARGRDLRRNNPWAAKAINLISSNIVGAGIKTQFSESENPSATDGPVETLWKEYANSTDIDFDGRHDYAGLQKIIIEAVAESGEVLVRKRFSSSKKIPLQFQVLESDFLDTSKNSVVDAVNGNIIIQGIEFDRQGRRIAYWLFENHPGGYDSTGTLANSLSNRIPAEEIYHIYRMDRPGQARGVTWLAPVAIRLKDLDDFSDATVMRQKVAACFTAFVRDISADLTDEDEECGEDLGERIEPGIIEHLPPGKQIDFTDPPTVENYKEFMSWELHGIAAGIGTSYEGLTGDFSDTNFSSARMGWIEFGRNIKTWRHQIMFLQFMNPLAEDFMRTLEVRGVDTSNAKFKHTPPRREMIDPTKEVPAIIESIRGGISTLSDEISAQGKDPAEHLRRYQQDIQQLDQLGIVLDSDASKTSKNGQTKTGQEGEPSEET